MPDADTDARRPARPRRAAAALVAAVAGAAACGGLLPPPGLEPPTVAFNDLGIDSVSLDRVRFTVRVAARNPNPIDLPLSDVRVGLSLFGQHVAHGAVPEPRFTLPAGGTLELPVAFTVATADLRAMLVRLARGPSSDPVWEVRGSVRWGMSPLAIPFQRRGDSESLRSLRERLGR
jgi:LEA14-like dessication related protein